MTGPHPSISAELEPVGKQAPCGDNAFGPDFPHPPSAVHQPRADALQSIDLLRPLGAQNVPHIQRAPADTQPQTVAANVHEPLVDSANPYSPPEDPAPALSPSTQGNKNTELPRLEDFEKQLIERGVLPKRRRLMLKALADLRPPVVPDPKEMTRVALAMGQSTVPLILRNLRTMGFNMNHIHHVVVTPAGAEILISSSYATAFASVARNTGMVLANPIPSFPVSKTGRSNLLRQLARAEQDAKHENAKAFYANWSKALRSLLPRPPMSSTTRVATRATTQTAIAAAVPTPQPSDAHQQPEPMEIEADNLFSDDDLPAASDAEDLPLADVPQDAVIEEAREQDNEINNHVCYTGDRPSLSTVSKLEGNSPPGLNEQTPTKKCSEYWIHLGYLNVRGLSDLKLATLTRLLTPSSLFFLAETWHINKAIRLNNPYVLSSSIEISRSSVSRGKGGITAICHPNLRPYLTTIQRGEFHLTVLYGNTAITAIYFPPSMDTNQVVETLHSLDHRTKALIGDFNISWPVRRRPADAERTKAIADFLGTRGMAYRRPDSTTGSGLDHTMVKLGTQTIQYTVGIAPVDTDHPMLNLMIRDNDSAKNKGILRYNISRLRTGQHAASFLALVDTMSAAILLGMPQEKTPIDKGEQQAVIELLDNALTLAVQFSLESVAGTFNASSNSSMAHRIRAAELDVTSATRAVKAAYREVNANKELFAQDSNLTPEEEAIKHYTSIYCRTGEPLERLWSSKNNTLGIPITVETVTGIIRDYPNGKSPGLDGIDKRAIAILLGAPAFIQTLTRLFNHCISSGYTPTRWNTSLISPIPKPGKDPRHISNRRPVALTVLFRRLFEKVIVNDLVNSCKLNRGQAGFRTGFSCPTQVLLAEQARHNGNNHMVFLDLKAAYDSVPIDRLISKMGKRDIPQYLIKLTESLMSNCSTRIVVNNSLTTEITLQKGLFQGSILSPILFDIFIDDLPQTLNGSLERDVPRCLLFADDILLTGSDAEDLAYLCNRVVVWCLVNEMAINTAKCGTFLMEDKLSIRSEPIPITDVYRYLGVPLSNKGIEPTPLLEDNYNKALGAFLSVKDSLAGHSWPPATKINIYKMFIRSVMEHGAPLVTLAGNQPAYKESVRTGLLKLQNLQYECLRWAFDRKRPAPTLESMAGLSPIKIRFAELTARFRLHLEAASPENPVKQWLAHSNAHPLLKAAARYPIPNDRKVESIKREYRDKAFTKAATTNRMARYIDPACRNDNGMDACLLIQNPGVRKLAIAWRCNGIGHHQKCSKCNTPFTRRHVECTSFNIWSEIAQECADIKRSLERGPLYTILDHLLNKRNYHLFDKCIKELIKSLAPQ
jgi:Reverse transcriptase (RNA-dependent DNA polymerase)